MDENLGRYVFDDALTRGEKIFIWIYLPIHVLVLPLGLGSLAALTGLGLSEIDCNLIYYALGAVLSFIFLRRFFRRSFDRLCDRILPVVFSVLLGYMIIGALSYVVSLASSLFQVELDNFNNNTVEQLAGTSYGKTMAMAVFLAPVVEEPLFRAGIFGTIRKKHRVWAYAASILLFGLYHVWQYAIAYSDPLYLLMALEYIPAGFALCWAYDRTGSIWTPIFLHMLVNWLSMTAITMSQAG